jgi:hypothetical protein
MAKPRRLVPASTPTEYRPEAKNTPEPSPTSTWESRNASRPPLAAVARVPAVVTAR